MNVFSSIAPGRLHAYFAVSAALHAGLLLAMYYAGPYTIKNATLERHVRQAQDSDIRKRIRDIEKIKSLLEQSQSSGTRASEGEPTTLTTPEQVLERARALSEAIEQINRTSKARELARLLKISEEEAALQLPPAPKKAPQKLQPSPAEALAELEKYQRQAHAALLERERQLAAERNGTLVQRSAGAAPDGGERGAGGSGMGGRGGRATVQIENAAITAITDYIESNGIVTDTAPPGGSWDVSATQHKVARSYGQFIATPELAPNAMRKLSTRALGLGAPFANRIYLNQWHMIGPFPGQGRGTIEVVYPPEMAVDLEAEYEGLNGRTLRWEETRSRRYPMVPKVLAQDAIYYAHTEVVMAQDGEVVLAVGSDDDSKLWLNDRLIWVSGNGYKSWYRSPGYVGLKREITDWNLTEGERKVTLKKGRNSLLFKLYNGASLAFFSVVIVADAPQ